MYDHVTLPLRLLSFVCASVYAFAFASQAVGKKPQRALGLWGRLIHPQAGVHNFIAYVVPATHELAYVGLLRIRL